MAHLRALGRAARILGLDVFEITLLWHVWCPIGLALGFYFFFYCFIKERCAVGASVFEMSDAGMFVGAPLFHHLLLLAQVLSGRAANLRMAAGVSHAAANG